MDCSFVTVDSDILGEMPVFTGSRVPIRVLFEHLKASNSLEVFLQDFPSVSRALAIHALEDARRAMR